MGNTHKIAGGGEVLQLNLSRPWLSKLRDRKLMELYHETFLSRNLVITQPFHRETFLSCVFYHETFYHGAFYHGIFLSWNLFITNLFYRGTFLSRNLPW